MFCNGRIDLLLHCCAMPLTAAAWADCCSAVRSRSCGRLHGIVVHTSVPAWLVCCTGNCFWYLWPASTGNCYLLLLMLHGLLCRLCNWMAAWRLCATDGRHLLLLARHLHMCWELFRRWTSYLHYKKYPYTWRFTSDIIRNHYKKWWCWSSICILSAIFF